MIRSASPAATSAPGSTRGAIGYSRPPRTSRDTRLVTSMTSRGQASSKGSRLSRAARTCSKLSSRISICLARRAAASRPGRGVASRSSTPSRWAMAVSTSPGSRSGARSTKTTPSAKSAVSCSATSIASRVLPTPPGPVSVSNCRSPRRSSRTTAAVTPARPMSGVRGRRRPRQGRSGTGESPGRAAASSSARASGSAASASASRVTVPRRGERAGSRSRSLTALGLSPARSARASWVRPAASRWRFSSAPKLRGSPLIIAGPPNVQETGRGRPGAARLRRRS